MPVMRMPSHLIKRNIRRGKIPISVIGLGYVGLHFAVYLVKVDAIVIGADIDRDKINLIKRSICPIHAPPLTEEFSKVVGRRNFKVTTNIAEAAKKSEVCIISVPTPIDENKQPDISAIKKASEAIGKGLKKGDLVILESTVFPGLTGGIVKPILEKESKLKAGRDFGLAFCLERLDPGNIKHRFDNTPRVVGGITKKSTDAAAAVYGAIIKAEIVKVRNCETAEAVKLVENIYRDINIAYVNEVAMLCEKLGIDILEVLDAASTKWSFHPHMPSVGVGGHCIPNNPYYLLKVAKEQNVDLGLVKLARRINEEMPFYTVRLVMDALKEVKKPIKGSKIALLGIAYKANVDDYRETPTKPVAMELRKMGANVVAYDPFIKLLKNFLGIKTAKSLENAVKGSDCILITTDHSLFKKLTPKYISKLANMPAAIVDGRSVFKPKDVERVGMAYRGIGRRRDSGLNLWNVRFRAKR